MKKTVLCFQYFFYASNDWQSYDLFLEKILKVFSRLSTFSLYNSESNPKILQFFFTIAITRLFDVITYNNNVTV